MEVKLRKISTFDVVADPGFSDAIFIDPYEYERERERLRKEKLRQDRKEKLDKIWELN